MEDKHGLSQYRLNRAKSYTQGFVEAVNKIELMFQMSKQGMADEKAAEIYISYNIKELERNWDNLKRYIEQRDDMR